MKQDTPGEGEALFDSCNGCGAWVSAGLRSDGAADGSLKVRTLDIQWGHLKSHRAEEALATGSSWCGDPVRRVGHATPPDCRRAASISVSRFGTLPDALKPELTKWLDITHLGSTRRPYHAARPS